MMDISFDVGVHNKGFNGHFLCCREHNNRGSMDISFVIGGHNNRRYIEVK